MPNDTGLAFHEPAGWPRPGGYANAVSATGRLVFIAGQIGWDPLTGQFASRDLAMQVRQALKNVVAALAAAGGRPTDLTRLTWFITDREAYMTHREAIGACYRDVLGRHFPAMSVVVVKELLEAAAKVEIEATAVIAE